MTEVIVERVRIISYKTIVSEQELDVDPKITVLIGGNETGKTNVLQAISKFSLENKFETEDVSRSSNRYRKGILPNIGIVFSLSDEDRQKLIEISPIFQDLNKLEIWKKGNSLDDYCVVISKEKVDEISHEKESLQKQIGVLSKEVKEARLRAEEINKKISSEKEKIANLPEGVLKKAGAEKRLTELIDKAGEISGSVKERETRLKDTRKKLDAILEMTKKLKNKCLNLGPDKTKTLLQALPRIYFVEKIEFLPEETSIPDLISKPSEDKNKVVANLLKLGGIDDLKILQEKSRKRTVTLRRAGQLISERLSQIWKQERIEFQIDAAENFLRINLGEPVSISAPPEERSEGFKWFFSFFVQFSIETQEQLKNTLILIDDPAINLHPKGQKDFLAILEDIATDNQVIYTTHSPFLINKNFPGRIRLLTKEKKGTLINNKPYSNGKSRFWEPLRSAIGISLGDFLFLGGKNLIVEGVSDQILLTGFNYKFAAVGNSYVDLEKIAIVPGMGADSVVYIAILASSEGLPTIILLDSDKKGDSIVEKLEKKMSKLKKKIIRVNEFDAKAQTIEDLIPIEDYLKALNSAYSRIIDNFKPVTEETLARKKTPEVANSKSKGKRKRISIVQCIKEKFDERGYGDLDKVLVAKEIVNMIQSEEVKGDKYDNLRNLFSKIGERFQDK